jgi:hypothetical protein
VRAIWTVEESQDLASTIRFYGSSKEIKKYLAGYSVSKNGVPPYPTTQRVSRLQYIRAQRTGFFQSGFLWFFNTTEIRWIRDNMVFTGFFNCFIIKQRNLTDWSTACLSVADIAGCATWAAGLLAATLAVDLLLIYYPHRAQLGVMGDAVRRVSHLGDKREAGELDSIPAVVESAQDTTAVLAVGRQRMAVATETSYQVIQLSDVQRCIRAQLFHVWFHSPQNAQLTGTREGEEAGPYQDQLCSGC